DYGQTSPGSLLRRSHTDFLFQSNSSYLSANLLNLPSAQITYDGGGNKAAEIDYTYDESSYLTSSGITLQHGNPPAGARGNLTTAKKWLNTNNSWITGHTNWYDTGEVYQSIDPMGRATTHTYDSYYAGAYSTKTCNALNQCVSGTYDFNTGLLT